ncbi:TSUP family transporter [Sphingomonas solaris]|uniref:Probable membrane transporter protein n=2 Tax=Alterirhizorhabdus solaris TaxID=2529389 RepID=A0A558QX69_9SPHN|nr:TSUP family transporter [Sphingomonas solaris]
MAVAFAAGSVDALAGGGGLLTIPALMAAGIPPVAALATNKLQSAVGTASAFLTFWRAGHVDLRRFALPAAGAFAGSVAGATAVQHVNPAFLTGLVPVLLILMALYYVLAPPMGEVDRHPRLGPVGLTLILTVIGFYDGFFGPGAGSFITTALVALGGLGLVRAIANTKLLNLATNIAALLAMIAGGQVLWLLGAGMAMANVAGNQVGARLAMRFGGRGVRPLLVIMSIALTAKLLADPANPLWRLF